MIIQIDENVYINTDQIQIIRQSAPFETIGRIIKNEPFTTIILQPDTKIIVKGYPKDVLNEMMKEEDKCGHH